MKTLLVKNIVTGTSTNAEALPLFMEMDNNSNVNNIISLCFTDVPFVSSSFLNSSIGEYIDKHGFEFFSKYVKFTDCKADLAASIKSYVNKYKNTIKA